jgi:hypothetical protein
LAELPATGALLDEVREWLNRYVWFAKPEQADILAAYVLHTYALDAFDVTPYIIVLSPSKQCGKSLLLEVMRDLVRWGALGSVVSAAWIYRRVGVKDISKRPALIVDEIDSIFSQTTELTDSLRGVINAGNRRGGTIGRATRDGNAEDIEVFSAKIMAGIDIGRLPPTIVDRSIPIRLERKQTSTRLARYKSQTLVAELKDLRHRLNAWARANVGTLAALPDPAELDHLSDRQRDAWEPLVWIADTAGPEWARRLRAASKAVADDFGEQEESDAEVILEDVYRVWISDLQRAPFLPTDTLLTGLMRLEDSRWRHYRGGRLTARALALLLCVYGVKPTHARLGDRTVRGYEVEHLKPVWDRYCAYPQQPAQPAHPAQSLRLAPNVRVNSTDGGIGVEKAETIGGL